MSKRPINLTIHIRVLEMAEEVMRVRGYSSTSGFVEELIRKEYERHHGPDTIAEPGPDPAVSVNPSELKAELRTARTEWSKRKPRRRAPR